MTGTVFFNTLRRQWRTGLWWGIGFGIIGLYTIAVVPNVDVLEQYTALLETMPPVLLQMLGAENAQAMATPGGFLGFSFYGYMMLFFSAFGVISGLNIVSSDEDRGVLDVVLSLPIPRWQLMLERFLAYVVIAAFIALLATVGIIIGTFTTEIAYDYGRIIVASINMVAGVAVVMAFTALVTGITRNRAVAAGAAAIFVIASYFIDALGSAASESLAGIGRAISYFSYYNGASTLLEGLNVGNFLVLIAATVVAVGLGMFFFQRRDVGA